MAGFQLSINGRFWVSTEEELEGGGAAAADPQKPTRAENG
jgi:hypothetical protein